MDNVEIHSQTATNSNSTHAEIAPSVSSNYTSFEYNLSTMAISDLHICCTPSINDVLPNIVR